MLTVTKYTLYGSYQIKVKPRKLTNSDVKLIRETKNISYTELAEKFGVALTTIKDIKTNRSRMSAL